MQVLFRGIGIARFSSITVPLVSFPFLYISRNIKPTTSLMKFYLKPPQPRRKNSYNTSRVWPSNERWKSLAMDSTNNVWSEDFCTLLTVRNRSMRESMQPSHLKIISSRPTETIALPICEETLPTKSLPKWWQKEQVAHMVKVVQCTTIGRRITFTEDMVSLALRSRLVPGWLSARNTWANKTWLLCSLAMELQTRVKSMKLPTWPSFGSYQ